MQEPKPNVHPDLSMGEGHAQDRTGQDGMGRLCRGGIYTGKIFGESKSALP